VNLGYQGARRIYIGQPTILRRRWNGLRNAVRRENDWPIVRHLVELVDEDGAHGLQSFDHKAIMDDLVAHVDRRPKPLERQLDDLYCAVDAGAKSSRSGDQDA